MLVCFIMGSSNDVGGNPFEFILLQGSKEWSNE